MKHFLILPLLALFLSPALFAQSQSTIIKGSVIDKGITSPIEAATIALYSVKDSILVKADYTDSSGIFQFEDILPGQYFVLATATGYLDLYSPKFETGTKLDLSIGSLKMEKAITTLKGITVEASRKLIERKIDRTVINVDASITNAGSTALEVLEKSPGVSVDKDGNVSMKGKQGVLILIDGRPSYLSGEELANYLRNMPSSNIDQIEIMTNPPAKYDASGNSGVINLKLKKIKKSGLNGSVSASIGQSIYTSTSNNLSLNYRKDKINLFGNFSNSVFKGKNSNNILRKFRNPGDDKIQSIFDQDGETSRKGTYNNLKVGMDFFANKKTTYGISLSGYLNPGKSDGVNTTRIKSNAIEVDSVVRSNSLNERNSKNGTVNFNFRHVFDSTGKEMTVDLDFLRYAQDADMLLVGNYLLPDYSVKRPPSFLKGKLPSDVSIYSAKSDLVFPLKKGAKIETGVKSSYVITDNEALYQTKSEGEYRVDDGKTNHFIYKENINAAYINYSKQIKKWGFQAGLRAENTNAKGDQKGNSTRPDSSFVKNYTDFFPTTFVSYALNDKNTFSVNYGRRVDRPSYQDLNPFYYFLDEYTYEVGNTLLQPQFSNNFELSHNYKGFLNTTLNYSKTTDVFTQVLRQLNSERKTYQTTENLSTRINMGVAVSANIPVTKFWSSDIYTNLTQMEFEGVIDGGRLDNKNLTFTGNVTNRFDLKKGWNAELSGYYNSRMIEGQIVILPTWRMDAGISKKILKDKGSLKLAFRDLFNTSQMVGYIRFQQIDLDIHHKNYQSARLTFSYRFGKPAKNGPSRKTGGLSDEESRIK